MSIEAQDCTVPAPQPSGNREEPLELDAGWGAGAGCLDVPRR